LPVYTAFRAFLAIFSQPTLDCMRPHGARARFRGYIGIICLFTFVNYFITNRGPERDDEER